MFLLREGNVFIAVCLSVWEEGCIPACTWAGGVYPSMHFGMGLFIQHTLVQGVWKGEEWGFGQEEGG